MNKLQELIQKLCPNGVEYRKLGEYVVIHKGTQFNKRDMLDEGSYPVINGGVNPSGYAEIYNELENAITISQGGASAGYVNWVDCKFFAGAHCYVVKPKDDLELDNRYLFFLLKREQEYLMNSQHGAGIPSLNCEIIFKIEIPIPPLEVQKEIVRILDTFTELQAELQARKQQYEYYRNKLLTFDNICGGGYKRLGDVCISLPKGTLKREQLDKKGKYFVVNSGREWYGKYMNYNNEGNAFTIAARGEYAGFVNYIPMKFWAGGLCYPYRSKDEKKVCTKFIYYTLKNQEQEIRHNLVAQGSIPAINKMDTDKIIIPIPPIEEQKRIVKILDKFYALVSDLSQGLPAEIKAVQQQYEYYRNKLLSFPRQKQTV